MNNQIRGQVTKTLRGVRLRDIPDFFPEGITWARANGLRQNLSAVLQGDVRCATEVREAVEGRSTQRIEVNRSNDRLKEWIRALKEFNQHPPDPSTPSSES
jgi:hypothetical protein